MSGPRWLRFEWDDGNIDHIARHNYTPEEAEEVFGETPRIRKVAEARYLAYGPTAEGWMTAVVFERRRGVTRVITAREMTESERRAYRRR